MLALPFTRGQRSRKPHLLMVIERTCVEAIAIDDRRRLGIDNLLARVPTGMTEFDSEHVQHMFELDLLARCVQASQRLTAGHTSRL